MCQNVLVSFCLGSLCGGTRKECRAVERRGTPAYTSESSSSAMVGSLAYGTIVIARFHQKLRAEAIFDERQC